MASDLQQTINEIRKLVTSNDLTNTPQNAQLAQRYVEYCVAFNEKMFECEKLLERNMVIEAEALAESEIPTLKEQSVILDFKEKTDFIELYAMYDWQTPPELRTDILDKLYVESSSQKNVLPLITAYRKVVRSEDIKTKILLLRKLVKAEPQSSEWLDSLVPLEKQLLDQLANQAKAAIMGKDFEKLERIKIELANSNWTIPVNPAILNKIEQVLDEHHQDVLRKSASEYLEKINEAYSCYDYEKLGKELVKWHYIIDEEGYRSAEHEDVQVADAEAYYNSRQAELREETEFNTLLADLQNGLVSDMDINELERLYTRAKLSGRPLPDNLEQRYFSHKESVDETLRRKRLVRIITVVASCVILLGIAGGVTYMLVMNSVEQQWAKQIEVALKDKKSSEAFELLDKLEKSSPGLRKRARILALETKAKEKQAAEKKSREAFVFLAKQIRAELKKLSAENKMTCDQQMAKIQQYIVDGTEENVFLQLKEEYKAAQNKYAQSQSEHFQRAIDEMQVFRKKYYVAMTEENYDAAQKALGSLEALSQKTQNMPNVSDEMMKDQKSFFDEVASLRSKLNDAKAKWDERSGLIEKVKTAGTVADMNNHLQKLFQQINDFPDMKKYLFLQQNLKLSERFISPALNNIAANNVFKNDYKIYSHTSQAKVNMLKTALEQFSRLERVYFENKHNMLYVFTLKNEQGELLDFYYPEESRALLQRPFGAWSRMADDEKETYKSVEIKFSVSEKGHTQRGKIEYEVYHDRNKPVLCKIVINNEPYKGTLIYPQGLRKKLELTSENLRAPHITFIHTLMISLRGATPETVESVLLQKYKELCADEHITPALRLFIGKLIMQCVASQLAYNKDYQACFAKICSVEKSIPPKYNWMLSHSNLSVQKFLNSEVQKLGKMTFRKSVEQQFYTDLYAQVYNRKIVPAGYVTFDNGVVRLNGFLAQQAGELWLPSEKAPYWCVIGTYEAGVANIPASIARKVKDMQLLYTVQDGKKTKQLVAEMNEKVKNLNIKQVKWPECWPVIQEK